MKLLINIDVSDLALAESFYTAAFDLRAGRRFGKDAIELLGAEAPIYLLHKKANSIGAAASPRCYGRHWSPIHCDIVVGELDTAIARAIGAGAQQEGVIKTNAWGRIAQLPDPFGHGWCLIQFLGRGYDEIAS